MERHQVSVAFFNWWAIFASDNNLPDPFKVNEINTNINFAKKWTLLNGQIITSFTHPLQEIVLNTPEGNIPAVPFKIGRNDPENSRVILVRDISQEVILGTSFIIQIYPFKADQISVHTETMGTIISFKVVTPVYQKDLSLLQNSSILMQINLRHEKKKRIQFLQNEIVYKKIEERLQQPFIPKKIHELYE